MNNRFRFTDLCVCIVAAAMILWVCIAGRHAAQSASDITRCAANLKQIHAAMVMYQTTYGEVPRTRYEPGSPLTAYTPGPQPNDVTAAAFLLARSQNLAAHIWTCPAALRNGLAEVDDQQSWGGRNNFTARIHYNYSMANMYPTQRAVEAGYMSRLDARLVVAADTNPGDASVSSATTRMSLQQVRQGNSPNHQRDGQNILFADGSVAYSPTPFVGTMQDNIYNSEGQFPDPANDTDAVLLPVWSDGPDIVPGALTLRRWVFSIALAGSTLLLIVIVWKGRRGRRVGSGKVNS